MDVNWKAFFIKAAICLVSEVLLDLVGLDDLANYGEFVFGRDRLAKQSNPTAVVEIVTFSLD